MIAHIDTRLFKKSSTLLITETTGERWAYYEMAEEGLRERDLTEEAKEFLRVLRDSCEPTRVSGIFAAGVGGSARAGVTKNPIRLTRAVHKGEVEITIGGARHFILPGGGINFLVNVEEIRFGSIYLTGLRRSGQLEATWMPSDLWKRLLKGYQNDIGGRGPQQHMCGGQGTWKRRAWCGIDFRGTQKTSGPDLRLCSHIKTKG